MERIDPSNLTAEFAVHVYAVADKSLGATGVLCPSSARIEMFRTPDRAKHPVWCAGCDKML